MVNINRALSNDHVLRSLTGLSVKQFDSLAEQFDTVLKRHRRSERRKREHQRAEGGGRTHTLASSREKLFFILLYCRVYPTMELAAFLFDVVKGSISDWVHRYLPLLELAVGASKDLPKRKIRSVDEFIEKFPEVKRVIIDSTERPRTRPKDPDKQKSHYSGKKKRHTMKNTIATDATGQRVLVVGPTVPGPTNDKRDAEGIVASIPEEVPIDVDLGYKGLENEFDGIHIPQRKPRTRELSETQKASNRHLARRRVVIEHRIGHVKRYRCVSDVYRNRRKGTDDRMMLVCCGLSNYYQRTRLGAYA